jgi:hypothetical protein
MHKNCNLRTSSKEKTKEKQLERPSDRREDNTKIDLKEIGREGVTWIRLTQLADFGKQKEINFRIRISWPLNNYR